MTERHCKSYSFFPSNPSDVLKGSSKEDLVEDITKMLLIRHFETRAEAAYMQGKIGGFFHAYTGQEAIQTAALRAFGENHWYTTTYRCHALALLLGATPNEIMAELFGKKTGNALGRGGSMHLYHNQMLGGFGIVGGHVPVAVGAAFSSRYKKEEKASLCFLGDGAFAQGAIHESLNYASLWSLPCVFVIENNQWGMGTDVSRAICTQPIAESFGPAYRIPSYSMDGQDYTNCLATFQEAYRVIKEEKRPVLIEAVGERFKGHSISDPGLYRSKEELEEAKKRDPIVILKNALVEKKFLSKEEFQKIDEEQKKLVIASLDYAEKSPFPDPIELEEGVMDWEG